MKKSEVTKGLRTRMCLNCFRTGGSNDDAMPAGWMTWSLGSTDGLYTLGWACSQECGMTLLTKQVNQFYRAATAVAASDATAGASGSRSEASSRRDGGCTFGVATAAAASSISGHLPE